MKRGSYLSSLGAGTRYKALQKIHTGPWVFCGVHETRGVSFVRSYKRNSCLKSYCHLIHQDPKGYYAF